MQFFLAFSVFLIYTARGEILTPDKAFGTMSLLNIMMLPLIILPYFIGLAVSASVSSARITKFLTSEELDQGISDRWHSFVMFSLISFRRNRTST